MELFSITVEMATTRILQFGHVFVSGCRRAFLTYHVNSVLIKLVAYKMSENSESENDEVNEGEENESEENPDGKSGGQERRLTAITDYEYIVVK